MTNLTGLARAPYSLRPVAFPLPALGASAARAALGGPRETAMACLLVGRLAAELLEPDIALSPELSKARAHGARQWLSATTLAPAVKAAMVRLVEASVGDSKGAVSVALDSVMTVTANQLDPAARLELGKLSQALAE